MALAAPAQAQEQLVEDTVTVAAGQYYHEELFFPNATARWEGTIDVLLPGGNIDVYIIYTLDLLSKYPDGNFRPVIMEENISHTSFAFLPPRRGESYSLIVDNENNSNPADALPRGDVQVKLIRTAPLHSSPLAQSLLGSLTTWCAVGLAFSAVGWAAYLKRKQAKEEVEEIPPRIEIDVPVPPPPRGAWTKAEAPAEAEAAGGPAHAEGGAPK